MKIIIKIFMNQNKVLWKKIHISLKYNNFTLLYNNSLYVHIIL